ncbi:MAG: hypothetical protein HY360_15130 [Verrucomicrobia bacterium]|nr:hypothetical protein [Verrucomicrobiota bacterium]
MNARALFILLIISETPHLTAAPPPSPPMELASQILLTGQASKTNGVILVEEKLANLVFGNQQSSGYRCEVQLRLTANKAPLQIAALPEDPADVNKAAALRIDLLRDNDGATLTVQRYEWDPEHSRWQKMDEGSRVLNYLPSPKDKMALANVDRDHLRPVGWRDRWLDLRVEATDRQIDIWLDGLLLNHFDLPKPRSGPVRVTVAKGDQVRKVMFVPLVDGARFLTADIARQVGDGTEPLPSATRIEQDGVPFILLDDGKQVIDVGKAFWSECDRDPSSYNEAYDNGPVFLFDPRMPLLRVPVADYAAVHLLAVAKDDANTVPVLTLRAGQYGGRGQVVQHDFPTSVPRQGELARLAPGRIVQSAGGAFAHIRVPFPVAFAQDLQRVMEIELTKEVRLARRRPDPARYRYRPLGLPSGVRVAAVTLERSPLQMRVTSEEPGHAFVDPVCPEFTVTLSSLAPVPQAFALQAVATPLDGETIKVDRRGKIESGQTTHIQLPIPVGRRGCYNLAVTLTVGEGEPTLTRHTSFALLPPDTRQHRDSSPFGTWDFSGAHFTCPKPDLVGALYKKAGLRYGMFSFTSADRKKWGVAQGREPKLMDSADAYRKWLQENPDGLPVALLLHEHAISGGHAMRVPDIFHDRAPYQLNEIEKQRFEGIWKLAETMATMMRANFPNVALRLGNGPLPTKEEFLRRKFPKELFDALGNEAGVFGRPPEAQPPDYVANNASLWMDHELLKAYGYPDKKVVQCYEICYPSTNPGNLSPCTQAAYFVRHAMHSLAWGVPEVRFGIICDSGSSYRFSNWGASGLVRSWPELNVKPSFVAVATMTRVLDGAKFVRELDLNSLSLYGVEFRRQDGKCVLVLWTIRGSRPVRFTVSGGNWAFTNEQGHATPLVAKDGPLDVTLTPSPLYLIGNGEINKAEPGAPKYPDELRGRVSELAALSSLDGWKVETERNPVLEYHNFMTPRRKGDFRFEPVAEFAGEKNVLRVNPQSITIGKVTMPMYSVLRHDKGIPVPGEPTEIGLWVNGNSSWGRIIFELQDASGQAWTSIGAPQKGDLSPWLLDWMPKEMLASDKKTTQADWNTDDVFGVSRIDFDGWRYVGFPLPGNYPGEHYPWPGSSQWRYDGDGIVHYPLVLRALIVELPEKTLHLTKYAPAPRPEIYVKRLVAVQGETPGVKHTVSEWEQP